MKINLHLLYLYLFSFVGLIIVVVGGVRIVNLALKTFVFRDADKFEVYSRLVEGGEIDEVEQQLIQDRELDRQRQRELSSSLAMIIIGLPLYSYHWRSILNERKE